MTNKDLPILETCLDVAAEAVRVSLILPEATKVHISIDMPDKQSFDALVGDRRRSVNWNTDKPFEMITAYCYPSGTSLYVIRYMTPEERLAQVMQELGKDADEVLNAQAAANHAGQEARDAARDDYLRQPGGYLVESLRSARGVVPEEGNLDGS